MTFIVKATEPVYFECAFGPVEKTARRHGYVYEWGPCYGSVKDGEYAIEVKYEGLTTTELFKFGVRATDRAGNRETRKAEFVANAVPPRVVDIEEGSRRDKGELSVEFSV